MLDVKEIIRLYCVEGMSARQIGAVFGVSHTKIYTVLKCNNIPRRTRKDAALPQVSFKQCVICGSRFRVKPSHKSKGSYTRTTCSNECKSQLISENQMNDNNSNWKDGSSQAHYQRIRKSIKQPKCEVCGSTASRIDTHHKDHNKSNNSPENIMVLCVVCHAKLHYENGDAHIHGAPKR